MTDIRYSGPEAISVASGNPARNWLGSDPLSARSRFLAANEMNIVHRPKFKLSKDMPIFTVGSCFAREIENVIASRGLPLLLAGHGLPVKYLERWKDQPDGDPAAGDRISREVLNKYCVHSMAHELRRVLLNEQYPDDGLIELSPGSWFDPHATRLKLLPYDVAMSNRQKLHAATSRIRDASVVFLTLGLTESWFDTATGLAMNTNPGPAGLRRHGKRFEFVDYDFASILRQLSDMIEMVRATCNPQMKFIVTVSPVPLGTTFRSADIIVGNSASKSKLRTVAQEVSLKYDFVDYFPSYEIVTNTPRNIAWLDDQIHVAPNMVAHIMQTFMNAYFGSDQATLAAA